MVYCAKSKTAKKRTWCKKTPCAVDSDNKSCILDGKTNRCRARISKKALPKKKSSKIIKKTKKTEEVAEVLPPAPPIRRSARLNTAKGVATPPKPMSKKASRAKVFNNKDLVTPGGLSTKDLVKSNGRIVSKVKSKIGKKNSWALAVKKARKELKIDGFAVIKKGEPIYDLAMKYYKGSVGGTNKESDPMVEAKTKFDPQTYTTQPFEEAGPESTCVVPVKNGVAADATLSVEEEAIKEAVEEAIQSIENATTLKELKTVVTDILSRINTAKIDGEKKEPLKESAMNEVSKKRGPLLTKSMADADSEDNFKEVLEDARGAHATLEELYSAAPTDNTKLDQSVMDNALKLQVEKALVEEKDRTMLDMALAKAKKVEVDKEKIEAALERRKNL